MTGFKRGDAVTIQPACQVHGRDPAAFGKLAEGNMIALKGTDAGFADQVALEIGVGIAAADLL